MIRSKTLFVVIVAALMGYVSLSASAEIVWETDFAAATQLSDLLGTGEGQFSSYGTKGSGAPTLTFDAPNDMLQLRTYNYTDGSAGYPYAGVAVQDFGIGDVNFARYELVITPVHTNGTSGKRGLLQVGNPSAWDTTIPTFGKFDVYFNAAGLVLQNQGYPSEATAPMSYGVQHRVEFVCANTLAMPYAYDLPGGTGTVQPGTLHIFIDDVYQGTFTAMSGCENHPFKGFQVNIGGYQSSSTYSMRGIDIHSLSLDATIIGVPLKILFIGNSFTNNTPLVPEFRTLAGSAGFATPSTGIRAVGGATLESHIASPDTLARIDEGGWDYVVLQEYSTRPTISPMNNSDPAQFEHDVAWLYDRVKATSPDALIVLYETWARHEDNITTYPAAFPDRDDMQNQLNYWYHDAAEQYVPANVTFPVKTDAYVAPCGEVWHADYHGRNYLLHAGDLYHQNTTGSHVNAMTILGAIYGCRVSNLPGEVDRQERYLRTLVDQVNAGYFAIDDSNYGPDVDAGEDQTLYAPSNAATLDATIADDGMPEPAAVAAEWTKQSGPGSVTFDDAQSPDTTATLSLPGVYVLRLTVNDGELTTYDELTVTYEAVPYLAVDRFDLGDGLSGWVFRIVNEDGLLAPYTAQVGFEGAGGATIQQMLYNGSSPIHTEAFATMADGLGNPPYAKVQDTWVFSPFGDNPYPGTNPLTGGALNGFYEAANAFAFSCYSGPSSTLGDNVNLAYVVADGNVEWTGTLTREGVDYPVSGLTDLPIPGDYNGDGTVSGADYVIWANTFGNDGSPGKEDLRADGNSDGLVSGADYVVWANNFGAGS